MFAARGRDLFSTILHEHGPPVLRRSGPCLVLAVVITQPLGQGYFRVPYIIHTQVGGA